MKKVIVQVTALFGLVSVFAATEFPNSDGKGDLASEGSWGGVVPSDAVVVTDNGVYTASDDVTFSGLTVSVPYGGNAVFDLSAEGSGKISLTGSTWNKFNIPNNDTYVELKGGTWDFLSAGTFYAGSSANARAQGHTLKLTSGVTVTNVQDMYVANYDMSNRVEITENSALHVMNNFYLITPTTMTRGNEVSVSSGGKLLVGNMFKTETAAHADAGDSSVTVTGAGSLLKASGYSYFGTFCSGNRMIVSDGADAVFAGASFYLGHSTSAVNRIVVTGGGALTFGSATTVYIGNSAGSDGNILEVLDGGTVEFHRESYIGYKSDGNVLTVSNSTLNCWNLVWGNDAGCSGNGLVVAGDNPDVNATGSLVFTNGSYLAVSLPDTPYGEGAEPVSAKKFSMDGTCSLEVRNLRGCISGSNGPRDLPVVRTTDGVTVPETVLAAVNAELEGSGAYFFLGAEGKELLFHVPPREGFKMLIR